MHINLGHVGKVAFNNFLKLMADHRVIGQNSGAGHSGRHGWVVLLTCFWHGQNRRVGNLLLTGNTHTRQSIL